MKKIYYCEIHDCKYHTTERNRIHSHHIISKEQMGSNKKSNRVYLCPSHHMNVYISGTTGTHSTLTEDSIIIHGWKLTTLGKVLYYTINGKEFFQESKN